MSNFLNISDKPNKADKEQSTSFFTSILSEEKEKKETKPKGPLIVDLSEPEPIIEEINEEEIKINELTIEDSAPAPAPPTSFTSSLVEPVDDEGPSLMELMMMEQKKAVQEKEKIKVEEQKKEAKKSFGGFKKGFFGNSSSKSSTTSTKSTSSSTSSSSSKSSTTSIPEIKKTEVKKDSKIIDEVQQAMKADDPLSKLLGNNEWVTPSLTDTLQNNPILRAGFSNPKCQEAIQLLQKDPKQAQAKYQNDPEVNRFMQEFGTVMSKHFTALGESQQSQQPQNNIPPPPKVQEIGPLHQQALQRQKEQEANKPKKNTIIKEDDIEEIDTEEIKVQKALSDPEVRDLLMDVKFQQKLAECGDPRKLQEAMRDPEMARKIHKLKSLGLIQFQS